MIADSDAESQRVKDALDSLPAFVSPANLSTLSDEDIAEFDAVFVPGGHGPMVDLSDNPDVTRVIGILHEKQAAIASVCHGPAFLLSAPANLDGQWLFDGYRVTSFTDEEEDQTRPGSMVSPGTSRAPSATPGRCSTTAQRLVVPCRGGP